MTTVRVRAKRPLKPETALALKSMIEAAANVLSGSYIRETDGARMIEIAPHRFVNERFLATSERPS